MIFSLENKFELQVYLGDIEGLAPDYCDKSSYMKFLVSQFV